MQLIDCSMLDILTLVYQPKLLVLSFMYLVLGTAVADVGCTLGEFEPKQIASEFPGSSQYMIKQDSAFNDLYYSFMEFTFSLTPIEILPSVQYCATYFILQFDFRYHEHFNQEETSVIYGLRRQASRSCSPTRCTTPATCTPSEKDSATSERAHLVDAYP